MGCFLCTRYHRLFPAHGRAGQGLRHTQGTGVAMYILGAILVVLLLVYLIAVLLRPEDFS